MNLKALVDSYIENGYTYATAVSKACQDIILSKISNSILYKNVTIKGGVVMMEISKDKRRATQDIDIDFIKYSLEDSAIITFIDKISDKDIKITIKGPIKKLHHQDYDGKQVIVEIVDNYENKYQAKIDIGVHRDYEILQDEFCFDLDMINESISLLVNSKEQIFVEKLKSLLKFGITSTRYKDIFDFYYLITETNFDIERFLIYLDKYIYKDNAIPERNIADVVVSLNEILNNAKFKSMLKLARYNWVDKSVDEVVICIIKYFEEIIAVGV